MLISRLDTAARRHVRLKLPATVRCSATPPACKPAKSLPRTRRTKNVAHRGKVPGAFLCSRFECERVAPFRQDFRRCATAHANPFSNSWVCTHFLSSSIFFSGFIPERNSRQCLLWVVFSTGRKRIGLVGGPRGRPRTLSTGARQDGFLQSCLVSGESPRRFFPPRIYLSRPSCSSAHRRATLPVNDSDVPPVRLPASPSPQSHFARARSRA